MVGECQDAQPVVFGALEEFRWGVNAIGGGRMGMQVNIIGHKLHFHFHFLIYTRPQGDHKGSPLLWTSWWPVQGMGPIMTMNKIARIQSRVGVGRYIGGAHDKSAPTAASLPGKVSRF